MLSVYLYHMTYKKHTDRTVRIIVEYIPILGAFVKLRRATISFVTSSVRPYGKSRLPLNEFSRNLIFKYFSKIRLKIDV
jgi:hypothetical protein